MCIWTLTTRQSNVYIPVDPRNTLAGCWLALPNEAVIVASTSSQTKLMADPIMNQPEKITLNKAPISTSVAVTKLKFNFLKKIWGHRTPIFTIGYKFSHEQIQTNRLPYF